MHIKSLPSVQACFFFQNLDEEAKVILAGYDQRQISKGGDEANIRGFKSAALNKNKNLGMQSTLPLLSIYRSNTCI